GGRGVVVVHAVVEVGGGGGEAAQGRQERPRRPAPVAGVLSSGIVSIVRRVVDVIGEGPYGLVTASFEGLFIGSVRGLSEHGGAGTSQHRRERQRSGEP